MDIWYFLYIGFMIAGAVLFYVWSRDPKGVPPDEYLVAILIPIWSALAYTAMATGQGIIEVGGREVYLARYIDWVVTTPMLLWALFSTAYFYRPFEKTLFAGLLAADVIMILSGLMADLSTDETHKWLWFSVGVAALVILIATVWGKMRRVAYAQTAELGAAYTKVAAFLTALWILYPLIWFLAPSGTGAIGTTLSIPLLVVVPILSKVGFSMFDLYELRKIGRVRPGHGMPRDPLVSEAR